MTDKHSGQGGTFEVDKTTGERRLVEKPTEHHKDGDRGPRDADGKLIETPKEKRPPAAESSLPAPAAAPPWATAPTSAPADPQPAAGEPGGKKKGI